MASNTKHTPPGEHKFYDRWGGLIILSMVCAAPFIFFAAGKAVQNNVNKVEDWLPKSYIETTQLRWFREHFISDQVVVISWDGCRLGSQREGGHFADDPRIERLAQLLVPDDPAISHKVELPRLDEPTRQEIPKYFKSVMTGRRLLERLESPPTSISHDEAVRRLQGAAIGQDTQQTCLIVGLHDAATREMKKVLGHGQDRRLLPDVEPGLLHRLIAAAGITDAEAHLGGPPIDNVAIDEEGERTLVRLAGFSALLGLALAWWSLRSVLLTGIVFATGVLSAATSLGIVWMSGQNMDAIMMSMPSLVYVLAISGAVHLVNYYREAVLDGGLNGAAERAVLHAWKPALLCSTTTAIGLISLYASELIPIQKFGVYSAIGVMSLLLILFFLLPAALHISQIGKRWLRDTSIADQANAPENLPTLDGAPSFAASSNNSAIDLAAVGATHRLTPMEKAWTWLASGIVRNHTRVSFGCILVICLFGYGLSRSSTSINLLELFDSQARILHDYRWMEEKLGMLIPLEVVVKFSPESQLAVGDLDAQRHGDQFRLSFLERMETVAAAHETILQRFGNQGTGIIGGSMSALTFTPPLPSATGNTLNFMHRTALNMRLESSKSDLEKSGFYKVDPKDGYELWRISLRVAAFKGVDYGALIGELNQLIEPVIVAHRQRVKVLRQLAAWDSSGNFAGTRVMVWNRGQAATESKTLERSNIGAVSELLTKARCKVFTCDWPISQTPLVRLEKLEALDAVVVAGAISDTEVGTLRGVVPRVIDARESTPKNALASEATGWVSAVHTGVIPIVYKAQRSLLNSLIQSTIWSFLTITPLMMLVSRSALAGMVAMIPNVLPVLLIFGGMGWLGIAIDIGSMMSASIALGVAVDDTIHFLAWYREELNRLLDRRLAIVTAYRRCATPTLQAALISGLGLSVFALSTFTPTQRFGWLMLTILIAGVVAELIMLPAILAGPLGRVFHPASDRPSALQVLADKARQATRKIYRSAESDAAPTERKAA